MRFDINYSLSSQRAPDRIRSKRSEKGIFGIGYSGDNSAELRNEYGSLPGTEREIEFLKLNFEGDYFLGQAGTRKTFLEKAKEYDVLHLAVHGSADVSDRYQSQLIFNGEWGENILKTSDLYLADLGARLAVLSACESGVGEINKGEGTFSIARGFALVGVPSVVMSLWQVSDDLSIKLTSKFYEGLSEDEFVSEALRNAKLHYLEESDNLTSHPFYWAAFVHLGTDQKIEIRPKAGLVSMWSLLMTGLILSVCFFVFYRRKRSIGRSSNVT